MSNIDKIAKINLENKPYVKPVSNVDIGFYNLDNGTAKLQFVITRDGFPMQMGPVNVTGYLWLKSTNGTMSGQLDLEIIDGLNGIVGVTIPNWFLVGATNTTVSGQIILAVNENTDIATLGEFSFKVADTIPNQIKGEIKVQYFRMFDDMKLALENRVQDIESRLGDLDLLVTNVETTVSNGISQINQTVSERKSELDEVIDQYSTEVNNVKTTAIDEVNTTKSNAISTVSSKVDESVNTVNNTSTDAISHVDAKIIEFNSTIEQNGFVQPTDLDNKLNDLTWQKYKLTNDNGTVKFLNVNGNLEDYQNLPPGQYYTANTPIVISGASTAGFTTVEQMDSSIKRITFRPYNSTQVWVKRFYNTWLDWERVDTPQSDTGWIPFQLINGALSNTAYKGGNDGGFDCAYRTITNGSVTEKRVRINASNLAHLQQIAQLPVNFAKNVQFHYVRVPINCGYGLIGVFPNGNVFAYIESDKRELWNSSSNDFYFYGEISWKE